MNSPLNKIPDLQKVTEVGSSTSETMELDGGVDIGAAIKRNVTEVDATTYDLLVTDDILHVIHTPTAAVVVTILTAQIVDDRTFSIVDAGGNAGTNNITIETEGAEKIANAANAVICGDNGSISLYCKDGNLFIA